MKIEEIEEFVIEAKKAIDKVSVYAESQIQLLRKLKAAQEEAIDSMKRFNESCKQLRELFETQATDLK